jgi:hypothetical protein
VFTSKFEFAGKISGQPIVFDMTYRGDTAIGGDISGVFVPANGVKGLLSVNATAAVGGSYKGFLRVIGY